MIFRKNRIILILLILIINLHCFSVHAQEEQSAINISSAEDLYALGRLLAPETAKTKYLADQDFEADFLRFPIPENITSRKDKIDYLSSSHYILTTDLSISYCQTTTSTYFMGLGCSAYPFSGTFDGGDHTISLSVTGDIGTTYYTGGYVGLFNVTKNATIQNLNISVTDSIFLKSSYTNIYFGGMIGSSTLTTLENCKILMENAQFGVIPTDSNAKRSYVWLGGLIGYCKDSILTDCSVELINAGIIYSEQEDSLNTQSGVGGLIGRVVFEAEYSFLTDCSFIATNSHISNHTPHNGATGAAIGNAAKTTITGFYATLQNSTIQTTAIQAQADSMYSVLSTGGLIGFSQSGSNNTTNIGVTGNSIINARFQAKDHSSILSSAQSGSELTAGGMVGCSFNNLVVKDSSIYIESGSICAEKTGLADVASSYGTQVGGIIGRLEHTGEVKNCSVVGNQLFIHSKSPNNQSNAGGIVGIDLGPYHKDVISINGCSFDGSGNSEICMEITSSDAVGTKPVCVGGIAGTSTYIVADCTAKDVLVTLRTPQLSNPTYCDGIVGNFIKTGGWWARKEFFTPRKPEIINCSSANTTPLASIIQTDKCVKVYTSLNAALADYKPSQYILLHKDVNEHLTLTCNLYIDLNGFNFTGTMVTDGYQILGMDHTTDNYNKTNTGHFSCTDNDGNSIMPVMHFKSDITGEVKRYMAIQDEQGWSFHRFYLGITHINLRPSVSGIGYKALFCGDDAVKAQLKALGYTIQLGSYVPQTVYKSCDGITSGKTVTLRLENFDVEAYGETPLSACVTLKLVDGTEIHSQQVSVTLRSVLESLSTHFTTLNGQQLSAIRAMIEKHAIIKTWDIQSLYP